MTRRETPARGASPAPWLRPETVAVWGLCAATLIVRAITMLLTIDATGDGPTHAMTAYAWSKHPYFPTSGAWLPGFTYWAGVLTLAIDNPRIAPRLLNLVLGTMTVPVFYVLVRRLYGASAALLSAAVLVILPLHVGLSVSSLTEPSFLFFVIMALAALLTAFDAHSTRTLRMGLFLVSFVLAEMTRYEAWPLIPLVLAYLSWKDRGASTVILAATALLIFPLRWSAGNSLQSGNALYGFHLGTKPLEGGASVSVFTAVENVIRHTTSHLGWLLPIAALYGLIAELARTLRRRNDAERALYVILACVVWALVVAGAQSLGPALYDRYLLFGCVLALPFATRTYLQYFGLYRHGIAVGVLIGVTSVVLASVVHAPVVTVTRRQPTEIVELAQWLRDARHGNDAVLMTKMNWTSGYLPLYLPQLVDRYFVVSVWVDDAALRGFIHNRKPSLLITQASDAPYRARIENVLGHAITAEQRVYSVGTVEVYDLSNPPAHAGS